MTVIDPIAFFICIGGVIFISCIFAFGQGRRQGRKEMLETIKVVNEIVIEVDTEPTPPKKDGRPS